MQEEKFDLQGIYGEKKLGANYIIEKLTLNVNHIAQYTCVSIYIFIYSTPYMQHIIGSFNLDRHCIRILLDISIPKVKSGTRNHFMKVVPLLVWAMYHGGTELQDSMIFSFTRIFVQELTERRPSMNGSEHARSCVEWIWYSHPFLLNTEWIISVSPKKAKNKRKTKYTT